ncbi:Ldh family oxidoreductase [Ancylobacter mangrovi]|uniref:Ldh family oxidoreductase n=1 Tax=Ancylobacter mangrovi TaxID=2972472 RepID=UPI002161E2DE|nr:Ldh family oxidoreductase [Ancylobacter mangrovi]MCS0505035.1 Ldh family oxidoreductase [Ancylobacter mangrovi]
MPSPDAATRAPDGLVPVADGPLRDFAGAVFTACGMPEEDARLVADTLVQADLWGHQSHGVMRLPWYAARLRAGVVAPAAAPERVVDAGAICVVDGHDGMGQVLTARAMEETIARARAHGVGVAALRNSNHFGTAMYFTLMAARAGCVGFLSTNASPAMAPWGGRAKSVGTNPWSWAAPAGRHAPMVLDIANTAVARGKIYLAQQKKLAIPEGWAIDAAGEPTTDAAAALAGNILPMAQHKGYAIAVMMDMLSGVLSGSGFGKAVSGPYQFERPGRTGHFMIAFDIAAFQPLVEFGARMEALIAELKQVPLAKGFDEIVYPGEIEARNDTRHRAEGLMLPADTVADLVRLADETGCRSSCPF